MLAELNRKITHHSEDQLTGDVFGTLRYLPPARVIPLLLRACHFNEEKLTDFLPISSTAEANYHFWPKYKEGEIDLIIEWTDLVIGIEVKYHSGLSSDDDVENSFDQEWRESHNQLSRYQRMLVNQFPTKKKVLIFLAPRKTALTVYQDVIQRKIMTLDTYFSYLSWEALIKTLEGDRHNFFDGQRMMIDDVIALLKIKGLERFSGFSFDIVIEQDGAYHFSSYLDYQNIPIKGDLAYEYLKK